MVDVESSTDSAAGITVPFFPIRFLLYTIQCPFYFNQNYLTVISLYKLFIYFRICFNHTHRSCISNNAVILSIRAVQRKYCTLLLLPGDLRVHCITCMYTNVLTTMQLPSLRSGMQPAAAAAARTWGRCRPFAVRSPFERTTRVVPGWRSAVYARACGHLTISTRSSRGCCFPLRVFVVSQLVVVVGSVAKVVHITKLYIFT